MLVIRYRRIGKRNFAQYKIVVAEKAFSVKGRFLEALGSYNPHNKKVTLKEDRVKHWISVGAQCSDSVHNLFVSKGVIKGTKRKVDVKGVPKEEEVIDEKGYNEVLKKLKNCEKVEVKAEVLQSDKKEEPRVEEKIEEKEEEDSKPAKKKEEVKSEK